MLLRPRRKTLNTQEKCLNLVAVRQFLWWCQRLQMSKSNNKLIGAGKNKLQFFSCSETCWGVLWSLSLCLEKNCKFSENSPKTCHYRQKRRRGEEESGSSEGRLPCADHAKISSYSFNESIDLKSLMVRFHQFKINYKKWATQQEKLEGTYKTTWSWGKMK